MVDISSQWSKQFAPSSIACSRVEKMGGNVITFLSQQLFLKTFVVYFKGFYFMFLNHSSTWQYVVSNMQIFFCVLCVFIPNNLHSMCLGLLGPWPLHNWHLVFHLCITLYIKFYTCIFFCMMMKGVKSEWCFQHFILSFVNVCIMMFQDFDNYFAN